MTGVRSALAVLGLGWLCATAALPQRPFSNGEVFAGVAGSIVRRSASGDDRGMLATDGRLMSGMCFDLDGNLYATDFHGGTISKYDRSGRRISERWGGPFSTQPESCVADAQGNVYVGEVDGENRIRKHDAVGRALGSYRAATEGRGIDWLDLAADQCTMFYTSEGTRVLRYDVCRDRQLDDFVRDLQGVCYALRIRENGEVIVACQSQVYRLGTEGKVIDRYPIRHEHLFAMNLDPGGEHVWTGGIDTGNVYRIHLESGQGTTRPVFNAAGSRPSLPGLDAVKWLFNAVSSSSKQMGGLAVYGERTAAVAVAVRAREAEERRAAAAAEAARQASFRAEEERRRREEDRLRADRLAAERRRQEAEQAAAAEARRRQQEAARAAEERRLREEATRAAEERRRQEEAARRAEEERRRRESERKREGRVQFGPVQSVYLGPLAAGDSVDSTLTLDGTTIDGPSKMLVSMDVDVSGAAFEVETAEGWTTIRRGPVEIPLDVNGPRRWNVRARVGRCTPGTPPGAEPRLRIEARGADSQLAAILVPLELSIAPTPWLRCWGLGLAWLGAAGACTVLVHGFVSPHRFARGTSVWLTAEEDAPGNLERIRAWNGFYRDARVFIGRDYRLTKRPSGALARLRADDQAVRIQPMAGETILWRTPDGEWETLLSNEQTMRASTYRNELGTIFFELRRG